MSSEHPHERSHIRTASLRALLERALPGCPLPAGDVDVLGVSSDSRTIRPGCVFVVVQGTLEDGARYAADAVARGAVAVVAGAGADLGTTFESSVPVIRVDDPRGALARLAAAFHGDPARDLCLVGITGTNGKTTTAHLVRAALEHAGRGPAALIGTIAYEWPGTSRPAGNTTPGAAELQALLAEARDAGCRAAVLEASSHALDQRRLEGMRFAAAVYTNLSGDHLDYHESMDAYAEAKARLFRDLPEDAVVAANAEDGYTPTMIRGCRARVIRYGLDAPAQPDVTARDVSTTSSGTAFTLVTPAGEARLESPLLGRYNVLNLLAAAAALLGLGLAPAEIAAGLASVRGVRGRLEAVDAGQPFDVLVDYAHTDDAVSNVLRNLRAVVRGRIITVLGCGGDRDRSKRPRMARAAAELSDRCWFTSDNPRTEEPGAILDDMLGGVYGARNVHVEPDRRAAIEKAVREAQVGDCVAILGKGHEDYQILGTTRVAFDDREIAAAAVRCEMERVEAAMDRSPAR